jgi:hypothetical protein
MSVGWFKNYPFRHHCDATAVVGSPYIGSISYFAPFHAVSLMRETLSCKCQAFMTFLGRSASGADLSERNCQGHGWCGAIQSWKVSISQPAISIRLTTKAGEAYSLEPSLKQVEAVKRCQELSAPRARRHCIDQSQVGAGEHPAAWPARPESHSALPGAKAIGACWNSPVHSCSL